MCIRDSVCLHGLDAATVSAAISVAVPSSHRHRRRKEHLQACLLYTSDAADDLLCVDLGGRRIIKKKQQHKYNKSVHTPTQLSLYTNGSDHTTHF